MLKAETLLSMLLLREKAKEIKTLSEAIKKLKDNGIDTSTISLRNVPGGLYSEDIESFIGRLLLFGYADQRSPITLSSKGIELCKKIRENAKKKYPNEIEKIEAILVNSA